jgi:hypothetical protein
MTNEIKSQVIPKISIFIDWSNIFVYAHYFSAEDPNNEGQQRFHEGLKHRGFLVHTHELVERPGKIYCSNCNIEININCPECNTPITLPPHKSKRIDILIALKLLQTSKLYEEGKRITIASFREPISYEYRASCDKILFLDDYIEQIKQIVNPRGGL